MSWLRNVSEEDFSECHELVFSVGIGRSKSVVLGPNFPAQQKVTITVGISFIKGTKIYCSLIITLIAQASIKVYVALFALLCFC